MPQRFFRDFVIGDDRFVAGPAGQDDQFVVYDERRARHSPLKVFRPVLTQNIPGPQPFPGFAVQTPELAFGSASVEAAIAPARRRSWTVAAHRFLEERIPSVGPKLAAIRQIVCCHDLLISTLLDGERPAMRDDERGISSTDGLSPEPWRPRS